MKDANVRSGRQGRRHKDGKGAISTKSGALDKYPYGFASRFEGKPGTNPGELIGAAHAGCFTMGQIADRGILPDLTPSGAASGGGR